MLLILEIGLSIYGLYALITGKFCLGKEGVATGTEARIAGVIFMLTVPIAFFVGLMFGILIGIGLLPESSQLIGGIIIDLGAILFTYYVGRSIAKKGLESEPPMVSGDTFDG
jgi:hypothetical protein